jgi:hypothetical protein
MTSMNMNAMFNQSSLPEPYPDESLSSWRYRVRVMFPEPEIRALSGMDEHERQSSYFATSYAKDFGGRVEDLDFNFEHQEILAFANAYDLSVEWIKSVFSSASTQVIPIRFRSDYCPRCMESSIIEVGLPVYLKSWRLILKPFCQKHGCVLHSADNPLNYSIDFAMRIFEYDCANPHELERRVKWLAKDAEVQALGKMVVDRIDLLLSQVEDPVTHDKVQGFVMTLLRITLIRKNLGNYSSILKITVPVAKDFKSEQELLMFYQFPQRVTSMARARSFYLVGLMLGWIDEKQAEDKKERGDFYLATSAADLWRKVDDTHRIRILLQLYSTELLGLSMLTGMEHF